MTDAKASLLIVDDEASIRCLLAHVFEDRGYTVHSAEDGLTALLEIREEIPDVILSDLNMPGMSGFEFLSLVRLRLPAIPLIAMSGSFSAAALPPGLVADDFYEKGTSLHPLLRLVDVMAHYKGQPPLQAPSVLEPLWIPGNPDHPAGEAYIMLTCPECLTMFPMVLNEATCLIEETACISCSSSIPFVIHQLNDSMTPQPSRRTPRAETTTPRTVPGIH
ncbi:MAG: response regulator [Edaphobacter sp.]